MLNNTFAGVGGSCLVKTQLEHSSSRGHGFRGAYCPGTGAVHIKPDHLFYFETHLLIQFQGLGKLQFEWIPDMTRSRTQSLIFQSHINHKLARYPPSVIAAASVLVAIR